MDERIAVLERDVEAIKVELTELRRECTRAEERKDIGRLLNDVGRLIQDVERLDKNDARLAEELVSIRMEMTRLATQQSRFATREEMLAIKGELQSDIRSVESNVKGWILGIALTLVTMTSAMFYSLNSSLKAAPGWTAPPVSQQVAPPGKQPPAAPR